MCKKWVESYPESIMVHGAFVCSDHCPILLSTRNFVQQCKKLPFRFQNFWCQYKQLDKAVIPPWHTPVSGTQMYKIMQRLKNVKLQVKGWAHQFFGNTRYRLDQNEIKLQSCNDPSPHRVRTVTTTIAETKRTEFPLKLDHIQA